MTSYVTFIVYMLLMSSTPDSQVHSSWWIGDYYNDKFRRIVSYLENTAEISRLQRCQPTNQVRVSENQWVRERKKKKKSRNGGETNVRDREKNCVVGKDSNGDCEALSQRGASRIFSSTNTRGTLLSVRCLLSPLPILPAHDWGHSSPHVWMRLFFTPSIFPLFFIL